MARTVQGERGRGARLRVSAMTSSARYTRLCRYSTLRLYTQAEPWMSSAAGRRQRHGLVVRRC